MTTTGFSQLAVTLVVGIAYYYCHWAFLRYCATALDQAPVKRWKVILSFAVVYLYFILVTVLELHLVANWSILFFLELGQLLLLFRPRPRLAALLSLNYVTCGLGINIALRSLCSLLLDFPLSMFGGGASFSDQQAFLENAKRYPVFFGFLIAGLVFHLGSKRAALRELHTLLQEQGAFLFSFFSKLLLYLFLCLNLFTYSYTGSDVTVKLWGLKSGAFVFLALFFCRVYAVRIGRLQQYRRQRGLNHQERMAQYSHQERLWHLAFVDVLTGCLNRTYFEDLAPHYWREQPSFLLVFVDLDGLKPVNDLHGHQAGDSYISLSCRMLQESLSEPTDYFFRYGGDEFLLLYSNCSKERAEARMQTAAEHLARFCNTESYPFSMHFSYGIADRGEAADFKELLRIADQRMYSFKCGRKAERH